MLCLVYFSSLYCVKCWKWCRITNLLFSWDCISIFDALCLNSRLASKFWALCLNCWLVTEFRALCLNSRLMSKFSALCLNLRLASEFWYGWQCVPLAGQISWPVLARNISWLLSDTRTFMLDYWTWAITVNSDKINCVIYSRISTTAWFDWC